MPNDPHVRDATGVEICVGDTVVYAVRERCVAALRVGTVTGFGSRWDTWSDNTQRVTIKVRWKKKGSRIVTLEHPERMAVLDRQA